jgi:ribonuclease BN (tRNA processing enzyme)
MQCTRRHVFSLSLGATAALLQAARASAEDGMPRVVLLGTAGGPSPKVSRAAPASMLVIDGALYVVDCGNGVARQIVRAGFPLKALKNIFITHHHSDHNLDYGNLFYLAWSAGLGGRVNSYGPPPLINMTKLFFELNEFDIDLRVRDEGRPDPKQWLIPHEINGPGIVMQDDRVKVTASMADHPPIKNAFSYRFDTPNRSFVFSGDTRKAQALIDLARGADVLVCEAQYLPGIRGLAQRIAADAAHVESIYRSISGNALSVEQAGEVAQEAGVKTLILNHCVPGDDSVTEYVWLEAARQKFTGEVIVGRDLLQI